MAKGARHWRSVRLLVVVFALIGAVAGFYCFLVFIEPAELVMTVVSEYTQPEPHTDATLTVMFFGRVGYTRTAPNAAAIVAEAMFWQLAPLIVALLGGALGGGLIGYSVDRWFPRARY